MTGLEDIIANEYRLTTSNDTLDQTRKISFDNFMRNVWALSRTNLHYIEFKLVFQDDLKTMFKPVKVIRK